jgi:hypothetical protein
LIVASVLVAELSPVRTTAPALFAIEPMRPETGLGGLVGLELRFGGLQGGAGIVTLHHGAGVLRQEFLVSLQVAPGLHDLRLILADLCLDLAELRLQAARIEFEEDIALLHESALLDIHLHDLAVHPGLDLDGGDRLHRPDGIHRDGHGLALDRHDHDRHRPSGIGTATATLRLRTRGGARLGLGRLGRRTHADIRAAHPDHIIAVDVGRSADRNDRNEDRRTDESHSQDSSPQAPAGL